MSKIITPNQLLGEIGETAAKSKFLSIGFQFDSRGRLEAGIDGIAEVMDQGRPIAKMIAVQVKATESSKYSSEDEQGFNYLLKAKDLEYWRSSNLPIIIVLYRKSDESFYWKEIPKDLSSEDRRLSFNKKTDILDVNAVDRLAALTVPKKGFGYYVPPLGNGEEALVNILPISMPNEIFVASTPYSPNKAAAILLDSDNAPRFDWVIKNNTFWSFADPRESVCNLIVDIDQVEAIETDYLALHEDLDEQHNFSFLLKNTLKRQVYDDLIWHKEKKIFYFKAQEKDTSRTFHYESSKNKTEADVVKVIMNKGNEELVDFVRHHAFSPRFELLGDQWYLIINPTYFFTYNGFTPHSYPQALLSGKKRMDNSASLRGQVIMWHRFLTQYEQEKNDLFNAGNEEDVILKFGEPPKISLDTRVPEDVWGAGKKAAKDNDDQERMAV
ncbi:MAG: hypothetical protein CBB87_00110 [Micavibrio sp. TMED27]|nr:hypothetical protein [Micavibrio sp.]OUT93220.1 MAG: hypothetical protein CBB87_00110 [Micavibrio sp. TMED27]|tara:strand:- start:848 stop:2170 length:1323 start_codon:yes stop_codon:yes gene_type:complete